MASRVLDFFFFLFHLILLSPFSGSSKNLLLPPPPPKIMDSLLGIMVADNDHFADIMKTIVFFAVIFIGGVFFDFIGGAPLVAEIIIGIILGPNGFNFVPEPAVK